MKAGYGGIEGHCARCEWLEADSARLRTALEAVEWINDDQASYCPWCLGRNQWQSDAVHRRFPMGHAPDCQRQAALTGE